MEYCAIIQVKYKGLLKYKARSSDVAQVSERSNGSGLRRSRDAGALSTAGHKACGTTRPRVAFCLLSAPEQRTLTTIPSRDCKGGETEVRVARRNPPCLTVMEGNEARGAAWTLPTRPARRGPETRGALSRLRRPGTFVTGRVSHLGRGTLQTYPGERR